MADRQFLDGGGEMGGLMRAHDWTTSPLGQPEDWPQSLRSIVALMINSRFPMFVAWGADLVFLYNDGYAPIFGAKHPHMLGRPFKEAWSEIWTDISPIVDRALAGEATYHEGFHLVMERNGFPEDAWFDFSYSPARDESGAVAGMFCACTEITARVIAEKAQKERESWLNAVFDQLSEGVIIADAEGRLTLVNRCAEQLHGVKNLMVEPGQYSETYHLFTEDGRPHPFDELPLARSVMTGEIVEDERWRIRRPDGSEILAIGSARPVRDDGGTQVGSVLTMRDDTQRSTNEAALRESEARFRNMADHAPVMMWVTDEEGQCTYLNRAWHDFTGQTEDEAEGLGWLTAVHPEDRGWSGETFLKANEQRAPFRLEYRLRHTDGTYRWAIDAASPRFEDGEFRGYIGSVVDIDERKVIEQALREAVDELRSVFDSVPAAIWIARDRDASTIDGNATARRMLGVASDANMSLTAGIPAEAPTGFHIRDMAGNVIAPENLPVQRAARGEMVTDFEEQIIYDDGRSAYLIGNARPLLNEDGTPRGSVASFVDITQRKLAEETSRSATAEFQTLADNIPALAWMAYGDGDIFWYNRRWYDYTGTTPETQIGWGWESVHHPDTLPSVVERWTTCLKSGDPFEMTFPLKGHDEEYRTFLTRVVPIRDEQGAIVRWFGTNVDISEQVSAEAALTRLNETLEIRVEEEVSRRTAAEDALRQSQKMEAIGQLTGGIAHDFNNLLQIITGNLDILRRGMSEDNPRLRRSVENAAKGAERAAVLTQRLLAFSRRQPLAPKVIDPNKLISGMSDMLHRALGETYAIETVTAPGLWRVEADPNQLESALLNLAINARDAMPDGGKLTVETANTHIDRQYAEQHIGVAPGQYVAICVSDTGSGMDPDIAERAFEPFFTTKDVGKGTGLGLSMVYGFVKQSGGHLKIYSEPDEGTTIKIYLPRHHGVEHAPDDSERGTTPEGIVGETILVCEDDEDVRAYSVEVLRELGYRVVEAADGETALRLLAAEGGRVDLLFTDIVLPGGMTGAVVAERALEVQPGLKVLFTTGYARNAIVHHGRLDAGVELLSKPFAYSDLAARIRELLDAG